MTARQSLTMMTMMRIGKMHEQNIVHSDIADLFPRLDPKTTVLICSRTAWSKAIRVNAPVSPSDIYMCEYSEQIPYSAYNKYTDIDTVVGVGGGTAIDIAKYLATKYSARCIAVPSMLSTNVFATDKVAEITPKGKVTTQGTLPHEVWVDKNFLKLSMKENKYGLADAMSIGTALQDWIIAKNENNEDIDTDIFDEAWKTLMNGIHVAAGDIDISELYDVIAASGYITNKYGSGRPESGSEHILAKEIESMVKVPHAVAVCCGIATMGQLQPNSFVVQKVIPGALRALGIYDDVKKYIEKDILYKAISSLKPRPDRYTIIDHCFKLDKDFFVNHVDQIIKVSGLYD